MRIPRLIAVLLAILGLTLTGCGWSPSGPEAKPADSCTEADSPTAPTVSAAIAGVAAPQGMTWQETGRGHTGNCRLYWVQISVEHATGSSPSQVLFFDRNTPLGPATPEPKPYLTVRETGAETVTLQYQWLKGDEPNCCPTGIGSVRFGIGNDGKLAALDPIPNQ
ncbi:putative lipoprotein LppP [Mycolicibacterium insubricum]|uniref:Uncharacterized protein n=1 Tax=Mycolicibacterium insubricum TaxID=444597 RepID=A0A1X0DNW8_9MYCO|nr:LppP/LprE family lipoprotein [Mycolicibacterium insubricum]MCV7083262.1 LppP/LprE family lipoprotein [Mycolicibacterium insubricum]ORA74111.1 hypothetical protein BST26_00580 [Mycolicibacterium insubricum]BBZ67855.1 putative lipoprotein LppP [Mycolicibacterium insubricum]